MRERRESCVHYNGVIAPGGVKREACTCGVAYESVKVASATFAESLPCLSPDVQTCGMQHFPTPEEVAEREREASEYISYMSSARRAIKAAQTFKGKKPPTDVRGVVECPKCKGQLYYSISSYNGHIWGRCATSSCLTWME